MRKTISLAYCLNEKSEKIKYKIESNTTQQITCGQVVNAVSVMPLDNIFSFDQLASTSTVRMAYPNFWNLRISLRITSFISSHFMYFV